jgi:hypothetical protein
MRALLTALTAVAARRRTAPVSQTGSTPAHRLWLWPLGCGAVSAFAQITPRQATAADPPEPTVGW